MAKQNTKVSDKYVKEAIDEYNNSSQSYISEDQSNTHTTKLTRADYLVVNVSYEDFVKSQNGKDMDDIRWT